MTKEEAIIKSLVRPNNYRFPSMIDSKRAMRAMDMYTDFKLNEVNKIHSMPSKELRSKIIELLYNDGADAIVKFIKGEGNGY